MKSKHCVALLSKSKCFKFNKELCIDSCRKESKLIKASYFYELKEEKGHSVDWKEVLKWRLLGNQANKSSHSVSLLKDWKSLWGREAKIKASISELCPGPTIEETLHHLDTKSSCSAIFFSSSFY